MSQAVLVTMFPMPVFAVNGRDVEIRLYEGDFKVFDQVKVICSTAVDMIDAIFISRLPESIKLIANIGVGYDNIDLDAASARGIAVTNTPVVTEDTADLTFLLILAASRQLSANERFLRTKQWKPSQLVGTLGKTVQGTRLGIIGFGEIGQAVARRAKACNMDILYHGPRRKLDAEASLDASYYEDLNAMLAKADIVSINCPLTDGTRHIMNSKTIAAMQSNAVLVNTARGALVDEAALVTAMKGGHLAAVGLDVFEREPEIHTGLLELPNVILTPHMGSATNECRQAMLNCAIQNILAQLEGRELPNRVNRSHT